MLVRVASLMLHLVVGFLDRAGRALLYLRDRIIAAKLRVLIRWNKRRYSQDRQILDVYWDDGFAELLEHWGEKTVWRELQHLLTNCRGRVLDIACGSGRAIELCRPVARCDFYGCDISDVLIRRAVE